MQDHSRGPYAEPFTGSDVADKFMDEDMIHYLVPHKWKLPFIITVLGKGTKAERTRKTSIECTCDAASFHSAVLYIFKQEHINIPLELFRIGYASTAKESSASIYNWDLSTVDLQSCNLLMATQTEEAPTDKDTTTVSGNKRKYAQESTAMAQADVTLRKTLGPECYDKLRRNNRAYCEAKYDLV